MKALVSEGSDASRATRSSGPVMGSSVRCLCWRVCSHQRSVTFLNLLVGFLGTVLLATVCLFCFSLVSLS